jgi:hypothetical protein
MGGLPMSVHDHIAVDRGDGHCVTCGLGTAWYGNQFSHLRGTAASAERRRLGLAPRLKPESELVRLTKERDRLQEQLDDLLPIHERLDTMSDLLRQLLSRPTNIYEPSHRRKADGGAGGKREQRQALRAS